MLAGALAAVALLLSGAEERRAPEGGRGLHLGVGLRAEGRTYSLVAPGAGVETRGSANASPRVTLSLGLPDVRLTAAYGAHLSAPDVEERRLDVLHQGELGGELRLARTWRLSAAAVGTYGESDPVADLQRDPGALPDVVASTEPIRRESLTATAQLGGSASRRTTASVTLQAGSSGGADAASRALLPVQRALLAHGAATYAVTRRDTAGLELTGTTSRVTGAGSATLVLASGRWRRDLTRALEGTAALGIAFDHDDTPNQRTGTWTPSGELGLSHDAPRLRLASTLTARYAPYVDRLTGGVSERLGASASVDWGASRRWAFGARASGARVYGSALAAVASSDVAGLDLRVTLQAAPGVGLTAGLWGQWQEVDRDVLPSFFEGGTYVGVVLERTPRRPRTARQLRSRMPRKATSSTRYLRQRRRGSHARR